MAVGDGARLASAASARSKVVQTATHIRYVYPARGAIFDIMAEIFEAFRAFEQRRFGHRCSTPSHKRPPPPGSRLPVRAIRPRAAKHALAACAQNLAPRHASRPKVPLASRDPLALLTRGPYEIGRAHV